jgi:hypothetical protein
LRYRGRNSGRDAPRYKRPADQSPLGLGTELVRTLEGIVVVLHHTQQEVDRLNLRLAENAFRNLLFQRNFLLLSLMHFFLSYSSCVII